VSVLLNTTASGSTTSGFSAQQSFATGKTPASVTVADVNGDGKPDVIAANDGSNTVSVLLNTTAPGATVPSFAAQQTFATGAGPISIIAADINGDGKPDLVVANNGSNTVSVLLNTTAPGAAVPSFAAQQTFATGSGPQSVAASDVNRDGKSDLIVANLFAGTVSVLLNTTAAGAATPSFAAQQTFAAGSQPAAVTTADVNGDGTLDLIIANNTFSGTVSILLNTTASGSATPSFAAQQTFATGSNPGSVTTADLDGDGKPDLIVANSNDSSVSALLNTTASGAATPSFAAQQAFAAGSAPGSISAAEVNGDGKPDLVVANSNDNTVSVLLNAVTPSFAIGGYISGNWFDPTTGQGGHGFQFEVLPDNVMLAIWFVFTPDGAGQAWLYAQGIYEPTSNTATLPTYLSLGAKFPPNFRSSDDKVTQWGTLTFTFSDCSSGTMSWTSTATGYPPTGGFPIQRLTQIAGTSCPQ
jgi:hypothetical protein